MKVQNDNKNKGKNTLFNYFTKETVKNDGIVTCQTCKISLNSKKLSWHRDFECKTLNNDKGEISIIQNLPKGKNNKRKSKYKDKKVSKSKKTDQNDSEEIIILSDEESLEKIYDSVQSTSLFILNDTDTKVINLKEKLSEKEKNYLQLLEEEWSSPEKSPFKHNIINNPGKSNDSINSSVKSNINEINSPRKSNIIITTEKSDNNIIKSTKKSNINKIKSSEKSNINSPRKSNIKSFNSPEKFDINIINSPRKSNINKINSPRKSKINSPKKSNINSINSSGRSNINKINSPRNSNINSINSSEKSDNANDPCIQEVQTFPRDDNKSKNKVITQLAGGLDTIDSDDDFKPNKIVFRTPQKKIGTPKKSPKDKSPQNKNSVQISIISDEILKGFSMFKDEQPLNKNSDVAVTWHTPLINDESNSGNDWCLPVKSMIVTPERTPSPSPIKQTPKKLDVSPSLLNSPKKFGLKVNFCNSAEKTSSNIEEIYPNTSTDTLTEQNSKSSLSYKGRYTTNSLRKVLSSSNENSSSSIILSPDTKSLNIQMPENIPLNQSPSKYRNIKGYYLENFLFIINNVLTQPQDLELLNEDDLKVLEDFKKLSLQAQKLYVRLFQRKIKWLRVEKIEYKEICDKEDTFLYINELSYSQFLNSEEMLTDLNETLSLLNSDEVQNFCKDMKIACIGKKEDLIKKIIRFSRQQKTIVSIFQNSGSSSSDNNIVKRAKKMLDKCCLINRDRYSTFMRIFILFSPLRLDDDDVGGQRSHMFDLLMVSLGKKVFPSYQVIRKHSLFRCRQDLLRMVECYSLFSEVQEKIDYQKWDEAEEICAKVRQYYYDLKEDKELLEYDSRLPVFLKCYTAISLLLHILSLAVEVYQRLKHYKKAVTLLEELLSQKTHLQDYRGRWFDRLALNLDQHLKNPKKALIIIQEALNDPEVRVGHKLALSQRAERLLASKKCSKFSQDFEDQITLLSFQDAPKIIIEGKCLPMDTAGYKRIFINSYNSPEKGEEMTMCSVEELVIGYYKRQGYSQGLHCEGRTIHALFGLYFWDIIYSDIPDAFRSIHQTVPLDLDSDLFYKSRKDDIDKRLKEFETLSSSEMMDKIEQVWDENEGKTCIVEWNIFKSFNHLKGLVDSLGSGVISGICRRLAMDHRFTRSGFPDLIVWNPTNQIHRIVEVKGPNDRLSTKQIIWLDHLLNIGAVAEVCHVEAVGAKRMGALNSRKVRVSPRKKEKSVPPIQDERNKREVVNERSKGSGSRKSETVDHGDDFEKPKRKKNIKRC